MSLQGEVNDCCVYEKQDNYEPRKETDWLKEEKRVKPEHEDRRHIDQTSRKGRRRALLEI